jgi:hypothetical protein
MDLIYNEINEFLQYHPENLQYLIDEFKEEYDDMKLPIGIAIGIDNFLHEEIEAGKVKEEILNQIITNIKTFLENKEEERRIAYTNPMDGGKRKKSKRSKKTYRKKSKKVFKRKSKKSRKNKKRN